MLKDVQQTYKPFFDFVRYKSNQKITKLIKYITYGTVNTYSHLLDTRDVIEMLLPGKPWGFFVSFCSRFNALLSPLIFAAALFPLT